MSIRQWTSTSVEETERIGAELAAELPPGSVVALEGDFGAGKTVFSRGFARGLGVTEPVSSPTYTIIQEYALEPPAGEGASRGGERATMLYHLDLYRIDHPAAALAFGVDEFLNDPAAYALVEWPCRIATLLPPHTIRVTIRHVSEEQREIIMESDGYGD